MLEIIRCPVCFVVKENCKPQECGLNCIASCEQKAIVLKDRAEIVLTKCNSCSQCVQVCPRYAIDKAKLVFDSQIGKFKCNRCSAEYNLKGNIFYLYPRRFDNERFKDFYETFEDRLDPWQEKVAHNIKVKNILKILPKSRSELGSLLDIGCAGGWIIDSLSRHIDFDYVAGLDISASTLEQIKEKMPRVFLIAGDSEYLPFRGASYDLALAIDVIEHIQNPQRLLREMSRVSKNSILKIPLENVFENLVWNAKKNIKKFLNPGTVRNDNFEQHVNFFTKRSAIDILRSAGFEIIATHLPDNPLTKEYTSFYFASPRKTMPNFKNLPLSKRLNIMSKYYLTLTFRRLVFIILKPSYHYLCFSSFYVYCKSKIKNNHK